MNEASVTLALETPSLLNSRQKLLELARKKVTSDGYIYKKGKSRSKQVCDASEDSSPKRAKTSANVRMNRISALEEDIKDFNDRLKFKEKRREQASNSRNYKVCDQLTEEMSAIKQLKREREAELHQLQRKQQQAMWYRRKKCMATLESRSDSDQSTLCSSEPTSPTTSSLKKRKHASPFQLSSSLGSPTSSHSNPCSTPHSTPCSSPRVTTPTSPPLQRKRSSSVRPSPGPGSPTDPTSPPLQRKRSLSVRPSPGMNAENSSVMIVYNHKPIRHPGSFPPTF